VMAVSDESAGGDLPMDEAQFRSLVWPLMDRAYEVAYQVLRDRDSAQDAAQEAAITAWRRRDQLRSANPSGWFVKISLNKARAMRRRRWFSVIKSSLLVERGRQPQDDPQAGAVSRLDLVTELRRLSAADRTTLLLLYGMDMSHVEAAQVLSLSERGVRSRERRALRRLRPYLEDAES
jgi:RNA polymerase sigma-70 factor, ECF subfamily